MKMNWRPGACTLLLCLASTALPAAVQAAATGNLPAEYEYARPQPATPAADPQPSLRFELYEYTDNLLPEAVQETSVHIGQDAAGIQVSLQGAATAIDGQLWYLCCRTLHLQPNVRFPLWMFHTYTAVNPDKGKIGIADAQWSMEAGTEASGYIEAGANGATFRKEGRTFILAAGEARLQKGSDSSFDAPREVAFILSRGKSIWKAPPKP